MDQTVNLGRRWPVILSANFKLGQVVISRVSSRTCAPVTINKSSIIRDKIGTTSTVPVTCHEKGEDIKEGPEGVDHPPLIRPVIVHSPRISQATVGNGFFYKRSGAAIWETAWRGTGKPKGGNCLLEKLSVTAFWLCAADCTGANITASC